MLKHLLNDTLDFIVTYRKILYWISLFVLMLWSLVILDAVYLGTFKLESFVTIMWAVSFMTWVAYGVVCLLVDKSEA